MRAITRLVHLPLLAALFGCGLDEPRVTAPSDALAATAAEAPADLRFLQRGPGAPAFADGEVHLAATAGAAGEITLHFADGSPFVTFRTQEETLRGARLRGRRIQPGETVWITMRRVDASRFAVELEPSGLVFNPHAPAELVFHYRHSSFRVGQSEPTFWRQEQDDSPWEQIGAQNDAVDQTFRAPLDGFTKYALGYGG